MQIMHNCRRRENLPDSYYNLDVIISVGYRVKSHRGTQFRIWATQRLREYIVKGFTLDDERLKRAGGGNYFDELLARIRDIRSSEKVFWRKVLDIYATSIDYDPRAEASQRFFATVQNKMHWAAHGQTAAEVISCARRRHEAEHGPDELDRRATHARPTLSSPRTTSTTDELDALNRIVTAYLEFAELQALNRKPMYMADWIAKLDDFLRLSEREILTHAGRVSHDEAVRKAELEFEKFRQQQLAEPSQVEKDFEKAVKKLPKPARERRLMPAPGEHKTVQARILKYAQEIGWRTCRAPRPRRGEGLTRMGRLRRTARGRRLSTSAICSMLRCAPSTRNTKRPKARWWASLQRLNADISGNRDFLTYLRNQGKFFCAEENRELDLMLIDYGDITRSPEQWRNVYEVTEEFYVHNGRYGTREDVVFLINGIPVLVIECKNASKDEAIALAVDQIRRYHAETPEVMVPEMIFTATEAIGFAYGVTWNTVRRNIFNWKHEEAGNLEAKVKSFCAVPQAAALPEGFHPLRREGRGTAKVHPAPASDGRRWTRWWHARSTHKRTRGLVWHTQGSGKTYTMIKAAGAALQSARGGEADHPADDRPQRAGRSDAQESGVSGLGQRGARRHRIAALNRLLRRKTTAASS